MRAAGLVARGRRAFCVTTDSRHGLAIAPNRLDRRFTPRRLNRAWAADFTACRTRTGWCYFAVVLDLASRRIVGWAVHRAPNPDLVIAALRGALPRLEPGAHVLLHSDRGIQYASQAFRTLLAHHHIQASMSRKGNCWDNAPVESFFSSFKTEAYADARWLDLDDATNAIRAYIDFYNHRRLHSTIGYLSPSAFEETRTHVV